MLMKLRMVVSALAIVGANAGHAHESDWLYFPMYERDTAHAVHLAALRFRPDGLLASATRYPRFPDEPWSEAESKAGWYDYEPRLIDCETGFHVETGIELLDRNGQRIAGRAYDTAKMAERLAGEVNGRRQWPSNSEILLACVAASHPALKAQRAKAARAAVPLISYKPVTQDLAAESKVLFERAQLQYDFDAIARRSPASAQAVFEQLRQQHLAWRKAIYKLYQAPALERLPLAQLQSAVDEVLQKDRVPPGSVRLLGGDVIEYMQHSYVGWYENKPKKAVQARSKVVVRRADCLSGVSVPLAQNWYAEDNKLLLRTQVSARDALNHAQLQLSRHDWTQFDLQRGLQDGSDVAQLCALVSRVAQPQGADPELPVVVSAEQLAQEKTPEAMLLKIRATWRARLKVQP